MRGCSRRRRARCIAGPARDRNYEFWGDQTFYGENPPAGARSSRGSTSKPVGDVDAEDYRRDRPRDPRDHRNGARRRTKAPASRPRAGICACSRRRRRLRGRPRPRSQERTPDERGQTPGRPRAAAGQTPARGRDSGAEPVRSELRRWRRWRWRRLRRRRIAGSRTVRSAGNYRIALVVDGKTVDTKPLRVTDDPDDRADVRSSASGCSTWRWRCTRCSRAINEAAAAHASLTRQVDRADDDARRAAATCRPT